MRCSVLVHAFRLGYRARGVTEAVRLLGEYFALEHPENVDAHFCVGWANLQRSQYGAAAESLRRAQELDPKREDLFVLVAHATVLGMMEDADPAKREEAPQVVSDFLWKYHNQFREHGSVSDLHS